MPDVVELAERFLNFSRTAATRAPLYGRLSRSIAYDPEVISLLRVAPETQQLPVLLFAAVHHLLIAGEGPQLEVYYPSLTDRPATGDPYPVFRRFALEHAAELTEIIATRSTQTNEVGRCSQFLPALGLVEMEFGPIALVDVGTSAGLNLLLHHYSYQYRPGGTVGSPSTVQLDCSTRGNPPIPSQIPTVAAAIGVDRSPIDVTDATAVRWLEACVWPDHSGRFERLVAAIALARLQPPDVRRGDAIADVGDLIAEAASHGHPVVTTSWVLNYLTTWERVAFVAALDDAGGERDFSWVIAESPAQTPELPVPSALGATVPEEITVVSLAQWRAGMRSVRRLATTHPHGFWLQWEAEAASTGEASPQPG